MKKNKKLLGIVFMLAIGIASFTYTYKSPVKGFLKSLDEKQLEKVQKPFDEESVNETEVLVLGNIDRNGLISVGIDADMMTVSED